jgi:LmbE family N-acetylglucosaminyl deacetylase
LERFTIDKQMVSILKSDRILVVAPHPDDESLGAGGLLQRAFAAGVPTRIVFGTNGDNNPWAQRYWERRWKIGPLERRRWGERRQAEALRAIEVLGGNSGCARFLNFPDQGITDLLMMADRVFWERLTTEICQWKPTLLIIPALIDSHPDHSAMCVVLSRMAQMIGSPRVFEYLVHKPSVAIARQPIAIQLTADEIEIKRKAIFCHQTQVELSGKRFTRFAAPKELYYPHNAVGISSEDKPIQAVSWREGILDLRIATFRRDLLKATLLMVFQSSTGEENRWRLPLPPVSGCVQVFDAISGGHVRDGHILRRQGSLRVEIPFPESPGPGGVYAKLSGWALFFDRSGWFQVVLPSRPARARPQISPEQEIEVGLGYSPIQNSFTPEA